MIYPINRKALNQQELAAYDNLSLVTGRFSEFAEDHINCPQAFSTEEELKQQILEILKVLDQEKFENIHK